MQISLNPQVVYQDDIIRIELDEEQDFIYVEWQRHVNREEFRQRFQNAAQIALSKKCRYWLSDARHIHFVDFSDQNWMIREMSPLLIKSNLLKFARISNKESIALLDVHRMYGEIENATTKPMAELEVFLSKDDAIHWLFSY